MGIFARLNNRKMCFRFASANRPGDVFGTVEDALLAVDSLAGLRTGELLRQAVRDLLSKSRISRGGQVQADDGFIIPVRFAQANRAPMPRIRRLWRTHPETLWTRPHPNLQGVPRACTRSENQRSDLLSKSLQRWHAKRRAGLVPTSRFRAACMTGFTQHLWFWAGVRRCSDE